MIDEKLADRIGPTTEEQMLSTLKKIEGHLKALVFHNTPERAFIASAGMAATTKEPESVSEVIKQEVEKYLKENK
jgi:phosphopantetheine adenylyltransferase